MPPLGATIWFLSCLFGSEDGLASLNIEGLFLSCLFGSEVDGERTFFDPRVSELPIRQ